jgi:hypothetical protein
MKDQAHDNRLRRVLAVRCCRRGLAAVAALVALAAAGCTGSSPPQGSAGPSGSGGLVNPPGASTPPAPAGEPAGTGARSGVTGGTLFGGNLQLVPETGRLGRKLAIVRMYFRLGEQFPTASPRAVMRAGSTLLASLDSIPGEGQGSYASITVGQHDAEIKRFLEELEQAAVSYHLGAIYFCFEHEANTPPHQVLGSPAQFVRAWDHIHALAASAHLLWNDGGRLHFVLILTHFAYDSTGGRPAWAANQGQASSYFPGNNEVDILAADGYNHGGCKNASPGVTVAPRGAPTVTPEALFAPMVSFARSQGGLPVFIAEWGSEVFADSTEQAIFIAQMQAFLTANHEIAAAMYFNWHAQQYPGCSSILDNQPVSLSALAAMGHSPALQGHIVPPPGL